jgi:hypothetical protein
LLGLVGARRELRPGYELIPHTHDAVLEDVGPQAAAVDERAQHRAGRVPLDDRAGLAQPHAAAPNRADPELVADQVVE